MTNIMPMPALDAYAPPDADACRPFLAKIAASHRLQPDDDGPRQVFADWLDERGDPWGEAIRIGVELADPPAPCEWIAESWNVSKLNCGDWNKRVCEGRITTTCNACRRLALNRARHAELLARHGVDWARVVLGGVWPEAFFDVNTIDYHTNVLIGDPKGAQNQLASFHWHGGLPADFTLPLDAWRGLCPEKPWVKQDDSFEIVRFHPPACQCAGTGRVNALAPLLLAAAPVRVEGLRFAGMEPNDYGPPEDGLRFGWLNERETSHSGDARLPSELIRLMRSSNTLGRYPTASAAHAALARAAIAEWTNKTKE